MPIIVNYAVTTASTHDSQIDLSIVGTPVYRDKGYAGAEPRGVDATMDKAAKNRPLTIEELRRNRRISKKRSPGERPYSVIKKIQRGAHVMVKLIRRARMKAMFFCFGYNALTLLTLKKKGVIA
jgi:IS5 family transposase